MNRVAAGTITRRTASSVNGTTTPTTATTILACVWLCPRIDVLVNSWTRVSVSFAYRNVAAADRMSVVLHSIEFFIRKTRSAQMYKDVHLCAMSSVAVLRAHTNSVNCPYRVQETCGMDSGYPCSCAVMIRAVQIKGRNFRQNCEWRTVSGFFTQAERDMSCAKEEETS